ncbi:MAG TPA: hypothetical protein VFU88_20780 [Ktedonobacterales bacterium]|nr:hypothetical protein [Ktedonobacterales bacterium]
MSVEESRTIITVTTLGAAGEVGVRAEGLIVAVAVTCPSALVAVDTAVVPAGALIAQDVAAISSTRAQHLATRLRARRVIRIAVSSAAVFNAPGLSW